MSRNYRWTVLLERPGKKPDLQSFSVRHSTASAAVSIARYRLSKKGLNRSRYVLVGLERKP